MLLLFKCDDDDAKKFVDTMLMEKNYSRAYISLQCQLTNEAF